MKTTRQEEPHEEHLRFALALDPELVREGASHVWSPYSVGAVLGLLATGAGGATLRELVDLVAPVDADPRGHLAALNAAVEAADGLDLATLNGLYVPADLPLRPEFEERVAGQSSAEVDRVDFRGDAEGVRRKVNGRVSEVTQGLVPELLVPGTVHPDVRMLLVNALWVKMVWREPFEVSRTRDLAFHAPGGTRRVPTMRRTGQMTYAEHAGLRMVTLEGGHGLALDVIVPGSSGTGTPVLAPDELRGLYRARRREQVSLALPRFAVETDTSLLEPLAATPAHVRALATDQADFSGISAEPLKVDAIVHQAVLRVDEKGAEGAAATAAVMLMSAAVPPRPKEFVVDRPFRFVLRRRGAVLFTGRVTDPVDPGPAS
ncbi:serpin family protein [Nocardiopsis ganjiahuensis]|uniref:serpin family protein n=1 Tax=Nocardiopsis ganjiahuensis TaxID=239984 RepID=UPI0003453875|nr:serpin family protein [Nocardiopsis ganjiahuensis]